MGEPVKSPGEGGKRASGRIAATEVDASRTAVPSREGAGGGALGQTAAACGAALEARIRRREARVAVVGLGYVGLPLAVEFSRAGFPVIGLDTDPRKVEALQGGRSYVQDVTDDALREARGKDFRVSRDPAGIAQADAVVVCVPTPLGKSRDPDLSFVVQALEETIPHLHRGMLYVLSSTTYPGTTDEVLLPRLREVGFTVGEDLFLAFSPERVDPGNPTYQTRNTPRVVGGVTPRCTELAALLFREVITEVVPVPSTASAEMVKLLENTFRSVNIGLVNEIAIMCDRLGISVWEVIEAAATKPFGFLPFYPGPGLGGHCIPIDPTYLSWKLRTLNYRARFIELAVEVNTSMPQFVVRRITDALNEDRKALNGSRLLLLGVAYKPDVDDLRESPALEVARLLLVKGARLEVHDPYVPALRLEGDGRVFRSVELTDDRLEKVDGVVILTHHRGIPYERIVRRAPLVVDTRNATRGLEHLGRVVKL